MSAAAPDILDTILADAERTGDVRELVTLMQCRPSFTADVGRTYALRAKACVRRWHERRGDDERIGGNFRRNRWMDAELVWVDPSPQAIPMAARAVVRGKWINKPTAAA